MHGAGLALDAAYLVRPDGYVALADSTARAATLAAYLDARALRPLDRSRPVAAEVEVTARVLQGGSTMPDTGVT